jgi:hypothetical protein
MPIKSISTIPNHEYASIHFQLNKEASKNPRKNAHQNQSHVPSRTTKPHRCTIPPTQKSSGKHPRIRVCTTNSNEWILTLNRSSHFLISLSSAMTNEISPWERCPSASANPVQRKTILEPNTVRRKWKCFYS